MRIRLSSPRVDDLYAAPELAVLAVLEAALEVSLIALLAADPDDDGNEHPTPLRRAARALADAARILDAAINRYRLALALAKENHANQDDSIF